jgi:hypothetical protein
MIFRIRSIRARGLDLEASVRAAPPEPQADARVAA